MLCLDRCCWFTHNRLLNALVGAKCQQQHPTPNFTSGAALPPVFDVGVQAGIMILSGNVPRCHDGHYDHHDPGRPSYRRCPLQLTGLFHSSELAIRRLDQRQRSSFSINHFPRPSYVVSGTPRAGTVAPMAAQTVSMTY